MRQMEQRARISVNTRPLDAPYPFETRRTELERATVEQHTSAPFVHLPQSAAVRAFLTPSQQMAMLIDTPKLQHTILIDNEFLIHIFLLHSFYLNTYSFPYASNTGCSKVGTSKLYALMRARQPRPSSVSERYIWRLSVLPSSRTR